MTTKKPIVDKFLQDSQKDYHRILTDNIIEKMKDSVKYEKPWFVCDEMPYNPVTKTQYHGINVVSLLLKNFQDPRFLTYNNVIELAKKEGTTMYVRKGEKGTPVFKAIQRTFHKKNDNQQNDEDNIFSFWQMVYAGTVFNASQIEGMPPLEKNKEIDFSLNEEVNQIVTAMVEKEGLKIISGSKRAYYSISEDAIYLPDKKDFKSPSQYYRTLAHELGHSTAHSTRLNRNLNNIFGSKEYAFEELIAELSSYFLGAMINLPYDPKTHENHAAYLKSWIEALEKDKNAIFRASSQASKATNFLIDTKKSYYNEPNETEKIKSTIKNTI